MAILYHIDNTIWGRTLIAKSDKGICALNFSQDDLELHHELRREFKGYDIRQATSDTRTSLTHTIQEINEYLDEKKETLPSIEIDLIGTDFQIKVWQLLIAIPPGITHTYTEVATWIADSKANRAVARAIATNKIALIVPCHRVLGENGDLTGYRWGIDRKAWLISRESNKPLTKIE